MDELENIKREDTKKETDKKCPKCGAVMNYKPGGAVLYCQFCEYEEKVELEFNFDEAAQETEFNPTIDSGQCQWGAETKLIICKSCGAESVYDSLQVAESCPYCGSVQVMEEKGKDTLSPSGVCPFQIGREKAEELLRAYIKDGWFTPSEFKEARNKPVQGVYLPFWTFDTKAACRYSARIGFEKTVRNRKGETRTEVTWKNTDGVFKKFIDDWLVLASTRYKDPAFKDVKFDTKKNVKYKPEFLAGFTAERYSLPLTEGWKEAQKGIAAKLSKDIESKIRSDSGADRVENLRIDSKYRDITYKYLLLPVWMSSCTYKDKIYNFVVNGQTGKVYGDTPTSWCCCCALIAAAIIILMLILPFFGIPI